tara:strand:- start:8090 stop:8257 length:168 start_codon:yes stop_codon:yes gene_type:complete
MRTGCQDVTGSTPSVFLDKNNFLKELAANLEQKLLNFQIKFLKIYINMKFSNLTF